MDDYTREPDQIYKERLIDPISISDHINKKEREQIFNQVSKLLLECKIDKHDNIDACLAKYYKMLYDVCPYIENFGICTSEYSIQLNELGTKIQEFHAFANYKETHEKVDHSLAPLEEKCEKLAHILPPFETPPEKVDESLYHFEEKDVVKTPEEVRALRLRFYKEQFKSIF